MRKLAVIVMSSIFIVCSAQAAEAKAKYSVSISAVPATSSVGSSFILSGRVSPSADGKTVTVQRRYAGGSWRNVATDKLSSSSKYAVRIRPTAGGPTYYRVVKGSSKSRAAGTSATRTVNVFRWRYLADMPRLTAGDLVIGTWSMKGSEFVKSLSIYGNPPVWDIDSPKCTKFRSFVGVDDDSPDTTTADTQVILDFATGTEFTMAQVEDLAWGKYPSYVQEPIPPGHSDIILVGDADPHGGLQQDYLTYGTPQVYCNS